MNKIDALLDTFPFYSEDLGIDLKEPPGRFKWFLASILVGARISEKIASKTYKQFEEYGLDSPEKIIAAGCMEDNSRDIEQSSKRGRESGHQSAGIRGCASITN